MFGKLKAAEPMYQPNRCEEVERALPVGSFVLYLGHEAVVVDHHEMAPDPTWDDKPGVWLHVNHPSGIQKLFVPPDVALKLVRTG